MKFSDVEIEKKKFNGSKELADLMDVNIKKLLISSGFAYVKNKDYFIGYKTSKTKIRPLYIKHPQATDLSIDLEKPTASHLESKIKN